MTNGRPDSPTEAFDMAASPEAAPIVRPGSTTCDTPAAIERFRMIAILQGLKLESKGIRVGRNVSCLKAARVSYGIKARNAAVAYTLLRQIMLSKGIIQP